tara:strand:+ start:109 stop:582 length:474 start_codon:yes stop_codon:yes gene_type:complete
MIQATKGEYNSNTAYLNYIYVNIYDKYVDKDHIQYDPIITITSQLTGKFVNFLPRAGGLDITNKERYVKMEYSIRSQLPVANAGFITLGNSDFPYGFYDITIRENVNNALPSDELVPNFNLVFTGLYNLTAQSNNEATTYTEYTTNDADTESVYITN